MLAFKISNPELRPSSTISVDGDWVLLSLQETSQVTVCFTERVTCLQRYSENLLSPSSCKPSRGKILKNRSTWGKSPCFIAVSNFSVTIVFRRCSASCRSFRLASIMPPGQKNKKEREEWQRNISIISRATSLSLGEIPITPGWECRRHAGIPLQAKKKKVHVWCTCS